MHRRTLLSLLECFGATGSHEERAVADTIAFVQREPRCFERGCVPGHVTGSAWVVDDELGATVLLRHAKLDRWLQPGGHADGDGDIARVALREAREETGLASLRAAESGIFDVDVHEIPTRGDEPAHLHYDVRFVFHADRREAPVTSRESRAVAWFSLSDVGALAVDVSVQRMIAKTLARQRARRLRPVDIGRR